MPKTGLKSGERQVATRIEDVRRDHRARYEWAAKNLVPGSYVIDCGCGIGYGARILADAGHRVFAVDADAETIEFARERFGHPNIEFYHSPAEAIDFPQAEAAVCFEMIEHVANPRPILKALRAAAPVLLASVPNEEDFPWRPEYAFHHRHYTPDQFADLLNDAGYELAECLGQVDAEADVRPRSETRNLWQGRTLVAVARRRVVDLAEPTSASQLAPEPKGLGHVVIIGLGPSAEQYMDLTKRLGGRSRFADQVWAINGLGDVLACDMVFHMDDIRVQERRAAAAPDSNISTMVRWMKGHPGPIMTSRAHPGYPGLVEFPLEDVINELGYAYFNGTAAYAAAYAIFRGASKISFFGCDYTYANSHQAEKGRACLEFWIGYAAARGIELGFADRTSLMDTCEDPADAGELNVYGYDFDTVRIDTSTGKARLTFEPKDNPPTAAEIERRYDHSAHVNPLLSKA